MLAWQKHLSSKEPVSLEVFPSTHPSHAELDGRRCLEMADHELRVNAKLIFGGKC